MPFRLRTLCTLVMLAAVLISTATGRAESKLSLPLTKPSLSARWYGIYFNGERYGFSRIATTETADGYEMTVEASVKMVGLGFSRDASSHERYQVRRDLSLRSFTVEQTLDGIPMRLTGEVTAKGVAVEVEKGGTKTQKFLKAKGAVYPPPAINVYPLLKGTPPGKQLTIQLLDFEDVKIRELTVRVVGHEQQPNGTRVFHLRNNLFPLVDNDVWVDLAGNTLKESVRDGLVETIAEDEQSARRFIAEAAFSRRDLILDFSLVRVEPPLKNPAEIKRLELEVVGIPVSFPLLEGAGQTARRRDDGTVLYTVEPARPEGPLPTKKEGLQRFLEPGDRLPADHPAIIARAREVIGDEKEPLRQVERLIRWVDAFVEDAGTDTPSPLDTLTVRKGNCQTHARLYTALARSAGIPTRFISGLAYAEGKGFLYHSWAESFVAGAWLQVDPAFGQVPVDATHVKLIEGDGADEMAAIVGVVGRIRARVVATK